MSISTKALGISVTAVSLGLLLAGCGGEPEFAPQPGPDAGPDAAPPPPPPTAVAPPPPQTGPCDQVQTMALTTMFQGRAPQEAPGMQPEGGPICGIVPEGQTISSPTFMVQQGFCYTFLAQALPTVTEVDLQLELDLASGAPGLAALNLKPQLQVDTETGPQTAIGSKQACYQWMLPGQAPVKLVVKARTGSGPVAAQAFKKAKK
jgi:hypothetical protein